MATYPPNTFTPDSMTIYNGRPVLSSDAAFVDTYTAWLVASRPWRMPVSIGAPLTSTTAPAGTPVKFDVWLPCYTRHVRIRMICTGAGQVTLTSVSDTNNVVIPVAVDDAGVGSIDNYVIIDSGPPQSETVVVANGENRAMNHEAAFGGFSAPYRDVWTVAVTNATGKTLKVWSLCIIPILPPANTALVA